MHIIYHYIIAFSLRLTLIIYGSFQDNILKVKYTDIDYQVFTDATDYVLRGESPFKRHTYRYTPFLAWLLIPNVLWLNSFGKIFFCLLDIITSILIFNILKSYNYTSVVCKKCCFMWLYNPITMVISSRGNAESIMTTLVMFTIYFSKKSYLILSGITYGLSVHFKIYPCIYAISFYFACSSNIGDPHSKWDKFKSLVFPEKKKAIFVFSSMIGFFIPTFIAIIFYGEEYILEALLYHAFRKDIRHNFSPYFYALYLSETANKNLSTFLSVMAIFAQLSTISVTAWVFYSVEMLPISLFIETFLFVTLNKVCTSQYFLWYMCLFPLVYPMLEINFKQIAKAIIIWFFSQGLWLLPAYYLEFKGESVYLTIFIASLIFYAVNMYLICSCIKHVIPIHKTKQP